MGAAAFNISGGSESFSVEAVQASLLSELAGLEAELSRTTDPARKAKILSMIAQVKEALAKLVVMQKNGVRKIRRQGDMALVMLVLVMYAQMVAANQNYRQDMRDLGARVFNAFNQKSQEKLQLAA